MPTREELAGFPAEYVDKVFEAIALGVARWNGEGLELVEPQP